jgi:hypothetical protein
VCCQKDARRSGQATSYMLAVELLSTVEIGSVHDFQSTTKLRERRFDLGRLAWLSFHFEISLNQIVHFLCSSEQPISLLIEIGDTT